VEVVESVDLEAEVEEVEEVVAVVDLEVDLEEAEEEQVELKAEASRIDSAFRPRDQSAHQASIRSLPAHPVLEFLEEAAVPRVA
jgi:hypothetical protein